MSPPLTEFAGVGANPKEINSAPPRPTSSSATFIVLDPISSPMTLFDEKNKMKLQLKANHSKDSLD
jgi:hypothetical protein